MIINIKKTHLQLPIIGIVVKLFSCHHNRLHCSEVIVEIKMYNHM